MWNRELDSTERAELYNAGGVAFDDPHFRGLLKQQYDIHGIAGEIYNFYSSARFQINTLFASALEHIAGPDTTWFGEIGMRLLDSVDGLEHRIHASLDVNDPNGEFKFTIDDEELAIGGVWKHADLIIKRKDKDTFIVSNSDISFTIQHQFHEQINHFDFIDASISAKGRFETQPHGLWGQTWQNKWYHDLTEDGLPYFLEGDSLKDYEVEDGIFGNDFKFNKYFS